ncbi:MAG: glycosyltransferase [bacterium]
MPSVAQAMDEAGVRRSIVIPCFNERKRLPATLATVQAYLSSQPGASEMIIVDDGSTDGTADGVREHW